MNTRAFTLSIAIALLAMGMVYSYIESKEAEYIQKFGKMVPVVIAKQDIGELELIEDEKVTIKNIPRSFVAPEFIKTIEEVYNTVATVPILKGEQITAPRITYPGQRTGLSRQVSPGKRAISLRLNKDQAVGRLIKPGDRVDVHALIDFAGGAKDKLMVKTILQDVLVLSTGMNISNALPLIGVRMQDEVKKMNLNTYTDYDTVTLEVEPELVPKLVFIVAGGIGGGVFLSLRNNDDKRILTTSPTRIFDLLGDSALEAKKYFFEKANRNQAASGARRP